MGDWSKLPGFLHLVRNKNLQGLKYYLEHEVDVNKIVNKENQNALHIAAYTNNMKIVILLCEAGINDLHLDSNNCSPLNIAKERKFTEMVDHLFSRQYPKFEFDKDKKALYSSLLSSIRINNTDLLKLLLQRLTPEMINQKVDNNPPIILIAVLTYKSLPSAELLIAAGADINAQSSKTGNTSLHILVKRYHEYCDDYIKFLLKYNALTNIKNNDGENGKTAYELALESGNQSII